MRSGSIGKPVQGVEKIRQQSLREPSTEMVSRSYVLDEKTNVFDLGIVYVSNDESISSSWAQLQ